MQVYNFEPIDLYDFNHYPSSFFPFLIFSDNEGKCMFTVFT